MTMICKWEYEFRSVKFLLWQRYKDTRKKHRAFITLLPDSLLYLFITFGQPNQLNNFDLQMFTPPREQRAITPGTWSEDPIVSD